MPSRTYIQMWLKLYNMGNHHIPGFICNETAEVLKKYDYILRQFPELVEHVVQIRIECVRFCKRVGCENIPEFMLVIYEMSVINRWYEQNIKEHMYNIKFMRRLMKVKEQDKCQ